MHIPARLIVPLLALPTFAFAKVIPVPPEGIGAASDGGGKQSRRTYLTGSENGDIQLAYNMMNIPDGFICRNGKDVVFERSPVTGIAQAGFSYDGRAKSVQVIFNPGGNPNPTSQWAYSLAFTLQDGSADFNSVFSRFDELDTRVLPGTSQVNRTRQSAQELIKTIGTFVRQFPPKARLVRNKSDSSLALVLPKKKVDTAELSRAINGMTTASSATTDAFNGLLNLQFDGLGERLDGFREQVDNLPTGIQPAARMLAFLNTHRLEVEQPFIDADVARDEKDAYNQDRRDTAGGLISQLRRISFIRRAASLTSGVMRGESLQVRRDNLVTTLQLIRKERGVLGVSHQGILGRIR